MIRRKDRKEALVPRDYWGPAWVNPSSLMADMDRIFDDFRSDWENLFIVPRSFAAEQVRQPLIDLADNGKEYVVKAEVPGLKKEDLNIEITENGIEISGETKSEENEEDKSGGYIRRERKYSSFFRSLPLPDAVLTDKADAELKDGVLTVKLPKAAPPEKKTKKVQVK
ncbi:MAG TPA: Hsp20/alpha crystallin family protein [Thermoplasmata archaeon]|nr:Hsp20/alpha crystallin family protein [Thermoplasmata archaeon]